MLYYPNKSGIRINQAYCGPTSIAALTGETVADIHDHVRAIRKDRKFCGWMKGHELLETMTRCGWGVVYEKYAPKSYSLAAFLKEFGHMGPYIVHTAGHFVAVNKGAICDTLVNDGNPTPIAEYLAKRKRTPRVKLWWKFVIQQDDLALAA